MPNRRQFLQAAAATGFGYWAAGGLQARESNSPNEKLNVGFVATGGRAGAHTGAAHEMGLNCICFAEVNRWSWGGVLGKQGWEKAVGYTDWRKMFEKHAKNLDVVFVATPDHNHFSPSMTAVSLGIHCYTEKPLTWSVREAQLLARAYAKNRKVVTQMGNQGHAGNGWRLAYEFIKGGAIGDVLEFHTWTDRPIWPQGGGGPSGRTPCRSHWTGRRGLARPRCDPMPTTTTARTRVRVSTIPSSGEDSLTLARGPWATWPATPPTVSTRSCSPATPPQPSRST